MTRLHGIEILEPIMGRVVLPQAQNGATWVWTLTGTMACPWPGGGDRAYLANNSNAKLSATGIEENDCEGLDRRGQVDDTASGVKSR